MKVREALQQVKEEKPHSFANEFVLRWLNELEQRVQEYMGISREEWETYTTSDGDLEKDLIVEPPYDSLYISWLKAKIDYVNEEFEAYANHQAQFKAEWEEVKIKLYQNGMVSSKWDNARFRNVY